MKKEEIEKIMLEEAEKLGIVLIDESGLGKKHLYNCLARIDAERGKEAIGTLCISHFMNDPGMENMEFQPSKSLAPGQYPLFLSPAIPEGWALMGFPPTDKMVAAFWGEVTHGDVELAHAWNAYFDLLAAAQGERNA